MKLIIERAIDIDLRVNGKRVSMRNRDEMRNAFTELIAWAFSDESPTLTFIEEEQTETLPMEQQQEERENLPSLLLVPPFTEQAEDEKPIIEETPVSKNGTARSGMGHKPPFGYRAIDSFVLALFEQGGSARYGEGPEVARKGGWNMPRRNEAAIVSSKARKYPEWVVTKDGYHLTAEGTKHAEKVREVRQKELNTTA